MKIVSQYTDVAILGTFPYTDEAYTKWQLLLCPACRKVLLLEKKWDTFNIDFETGYEVEEELLYPANIITTEGLPEKVRKSFEAALRVRNVEPNAFAVLIGRTLEFICKDRNAKGKNLNEKLDYLSSIQDIPGSLAKMAHSIRALRNIGAHASDDNITESDVPVLIQFTESILDYVYRAPARLEAVKRRIQKEKT